MKILLIGADGQLGSDIQKVMPKEDLISLTLNDLDIRKMKDTHMIIEKARPDIVINTAAMTNVDLCEEETEEAFAVNAFGAKFVAQSCAAIDCVLVHISTDYIFGAHNDLHIPLAEEDAPGPVNVYGISKLAGEYFVKNTLSKYFIVRSSGLFGAAGALGKGGNFVETMICLGRQKKEIKVVNDQIVSPTYTKNLASNIWKLIQTEKYGIYHIVSSGPCTWYEFAKGIFNTLRMDVRILPCTSFEYTLPAKRPKYSALSPAKFQSLGIGSIVSLKENLKDYLMEKGYTA